MDPLDADDLYDRVAYSDRKGKAAAFEEIGSGIPRGEYGRVLFLATAAEHWMIEGDLERARTLLETIEHDPSEGQLHTRSTQLYLAYRLEDRAWATELLTVLLTEFRADRVNAATCHHVGETLALAGELTKAHRWFTLPLSNVDPDDELDVMEEMCVLSRAGVRRDLGLPHDRYDAVADELRHG